MNSSFFLQQKQKTSNLDANLISRHFRLNLMADFVRLKYEKPRMKQSQIANQMNLSTSTLQRYRNDENMLSPYRINPNNTNKRTKMDLNGNFDNNSHHKSNVKRPQRTSNDLKRLQSISEILHEVEPDKSKNKLKGGANFEINDHYSDESLQNNNPYMELAMQIISND